MRWNVIHDIQHTDSNQYRKLHTHRIYFRWGVGEVYSNAISWLRSIGGGGSNSCNIRCQMDYKYNAQNFKRSQRKKNEGEVRSIKSILANSLTTLTFVCIDKTGFENGTPWETKLDCGSVPVLYLDFVRQILKKNMYCNRSFALFTLETKVQSKT